jgi:hypothetical protein
MQWIDRVSVRRGRVVAWSEWSIKELPTTFGFVFVVLGPEGGDGSPWLLVVLWACLAAMLVLSLRRATLFVAVPGRGWWLPSLLFPWTWRRPPAGEVSVRRCLTVDAPTMLVGRRRGPDAWTVWVGEEPLLCRTEGAAAAELARKIALLLGRTLRDEDGTLHAAAGVAALPRPRVVPGTEPEGAALPRLSDNAVALPAGAAMGTRNVPAGAAPALALMISLCALVALTIALDGPVRMVWFPGMLLIVVLLFASSWSGHQSFKRAARLELRRDGVAVLAGRQFGWLARPVPVEDVQAVELLHGCVVLRLAEGDVEVAGAVLERAQAVWLRDWLQNRIARRL